MERQYGATSLALLTEKVPRRLLPHASLERLRATAALDTILLDDGEELLLFIDSLLGDGGGRILEGIGQELASRALGQGAVAKLGDLHGTVARLQAFLDHPFVETPTLFELKRTDLGFLLTVGVMGRPRATRVLKHLALGAIAAAARSAREGAVMKVSSELVADRATLSVHYQRSEPPRWSEPPARTDSEFPSTSARRSSHSFRPPSLSEEVERILSSHRPPFVPKTTPAPRSYRSAPPPAVEKAPTSERPSEIQPVARPRSSERPPAERTSEVQPVAPRSSSPDVTPSERRRSKG